MFKTRIAVLALVASFVGVTSWAVAQGEPADADGKLLDILKRRGIITDAEYADLKKDFAEIRAQSDLETRVEGQVDSMVSRLVQDAPKTSYKPGNGFTFATADGNFSLNVTGRIQTRFTYEFRERETPNNPQGQDLQNFAVQRARFMLRGFAFDPKLKYELQIDAAGDPVTAGSSTSSNRFTNLRTAFIEYDFDPAFNVGAGQLKAPYGRSSEMTGSGVLEFVDRSIIAGVFEPAYETGLYIFGKFGGEKSDFIEYGLGVYDGEPQNTFNNDDGLEYMGRVAISPWGMVPYSEADLRPAEERHDFKATFALNALYDQENNTSFPAPDAGLSTYEDNYRLGLDLTMIWEGFYSQTEFHYRRDHDVTERETTGWFSQLGYCVIPEKLDVGIRYSVADWDYETAGLAALSAAGSNTSNLPTALREYLLVVGYYWHGHADKLQLDFGRVEDHRFDRATSSSDFDEWRLRLQLQLIF